MKYNAKYDRWFTKGGLVYRYNESQDKLVLCKQYKTKKGYLCFNAKDKHWNTHRAIYETFVGEIPDGFVVDHINTQRDDNRIENLRAVTPKENSNNPLTIKHNREAQKGKVLSDETRAKISEAIKGKTHSEETIKKMSESQINKPKSEFGIKYYEHYGYSYSENSKQYRIEYKYYCKNGKCSWELEK